MLWLIYNLLFAVAFVFMLPKFLWRMRRRGGYAKDFGQRFGAYRPEVRERIGDGGRVWIHAVSVGEVFVGLSMLEELRRKRPALRFVVSTTTSTGYRIVQDQLKDPDVGIYFPLDFPPFVHRAVRTIRPTALILVEAEFWPNLVRLVSRRDIPLFLVNGRISPSSYRGYLKLRPFTRRIFRLFDALCVQGEQDRQCLLDLGAPPELVQVMNSVKYQVGSSDTENVEQIGTVLGDAGLNGERSILLGGSTWPGEEAALLDIYEALRDQHPSLALVLVPRHVERTPQVVEEITGRGLTLQLRSEVGEDRREKAADVFVVDTTGELKSFYPHASLIFIGKSLCAEGGQNIIEPAAFGKSVLVGPHMGNFPVIMKDFLQAGAIRQVADQPALQEAVASLLGDASARDQLGRNAEALVKEKSGAVTQTADVILGIMDQGASA